MVGRFEKYSQLIVIITNMNGTCKKTFPKPKSCMAVSILLTKITLIKFKNTITSSSYLYLKNPNLYQTCMFIVS